MLTYVNRPVLLLESLSARICEIAMTFEVTLTKVSRPFERAFFPTISKPSLELEILSRTVGPLPLLNTPSALPLPACSCGPLHRLQEAWISRWH